MLTEEHLCASITLALEAIAANQILLPVHVGADGHCRRHRLSHRHRAHCRGVEDTKEIVAQLYRLYTDFVAEMYDWVSSHRIEELRAPALLPRASER
jgi:hypothetical protein